LILLLFILFGSYLRFVNLGVPSFWVDEMDFVEAARSMLQVGEPLLDSGYPYTRAPLLTYSLMASFKLFGVSEFSSRLPSAIFGVFSIPLIFVIGRGLFNERVGVLSALFLTVSPFAVGWSRTSRMYALFQLLFLAGLYYFYLGFENRPLSYSLKNWQGVLSIKRVRNVYIWIHNFLTSWQLHLPRMFLGSILLLLSYSTHKNTGLFILTFAGYLLIWGITLIIKKGIVVALRSKYIILLTLIICTLVFFLEPFREFIGYALSYQPKWAEGSSAQNPWRIIEFLFSARRMPFNIFFIAGMILLVKHWQQNGVFVLLILMIPIVMFSFVFQYRKIDYIFHVYPLFYIVGAYSLDFFVAKLTNAKFLEKIIQRFSVLFRMMPSWVHTVFSKNMVVTGLCIIWLPFTFNFRFSQKIPRLSDGHFNGAISHNEFKEATSFLQQRLSPDDMIISTLALTVKHYLGRVDYNLNMANSDFSKKNNIFDADGQLIDFYSGAPLINDMQELKSVLKTNLRGWLVVDNYRFQHDVYVPAEIRNFVSACITKTFETRNKTVTVFRWQDANGLNFLNEAK